MYSAHKMWHLLSYQSLPCSRRLIAGFQAIPLGEMWGHFDVIFAGEVCDSASEWCQLIQAHIWANDGTWAKCTFIILIVHVGSNSGVNKTAIRVPCNMPGAGNVTNLAALSDKHETIKMDSVTHQGWIGETRISFPHQMRWDALCSSFTFLFHFVNSAAFSSMTFWFQCDFKIS